MSPKGLLKIEMGNAEDEFTLSSACTSCTSGDAWKVASSKASGGCGSGAACAGFDAVRMCESKVGNIARAEKKLTIWINFLNALLDCGFALFCAEGLVLYFHF